MKPINTKNMMTAYKKYKRLNDEADMIRRGYPNSFFDRSDFKWMSEKAEEAKVAFIESAKKLIEVLAEVQKRCSSRIISPAIMLAFLLRLESKLDLPKALLEGIHVYADLNAQTFAKSYAKNAHGSRPQSTIFRAEYHAGSWRITDIERDDTWQKGRGNALINYTPEAKKALLERLAFLSV